MTTTNSNTEKKMQKELSKLKTERFKKTHIQLSKIKRKIFKHTLFLRAILIFSVLAVIYLISLLTFNIIKKSKLGYYISIAKIATTAPINQTKAIGGKINVLILGKGGANHDAPDLTDTIMFLSLDTIKDQVNIVSLPRDIWIAELRAKLNSTYYWGNQNKAGGGLILAKSQVEKIVGQPIQYAVVFDFTSFKEIINVLGGIEVEIDNPFTDERYPIEGKENDECDNDPEFLCRYETISFEKGIVHMDGETALKFARSRNAQGDEGTDLARAKRQKQIILATKNKILSLNPLKNYKTFLEIKSILEKEVETDISTKEAIIIARHTFDAKENIKTPAIPEGYFEVPPTGSRYDNLYVFIPSSGDWKEVQRWIKCQLEGNCFD